MFDPTTKFLVVDDFATMRKIVKRILDELGYRNVIEACNGRDAIQKINDSLEQNEPIQFIVSDWNMPVMQGIELLKRCRQDDRLKGLPFMLVTAESERDQILEAVNAGVSEYVTKPFNPLTFKQKIEKVYLKTSQIPPTEVAKKVG